MFCLLTVQALSHTSLSLSHVSHVSLTRLSLSLSRLSLSFTFSFSFNLSLVSLTGCYTCPQNFAPPAGAAAGAGAEAGTERAVAVGVEPLLAPPPPRWLFIME